MSCGPPGLVQSSAKPSKLRAEREWALAAAVGSAQSDLASCGLGLLKQLHRIIVVGDRLAVHCHQALQWGGE